MGSSDRSDSHASAADSFAAYLQHTSGRECAAIARELHDEVGGVLAAAKIELDVIGRLIPEGTSAVHSRLLRLSSALDTGLTVERRLVERLRPSALDHLGLYAALRWQISEQCKATGCHCVFTVEGAEPNHVPDTAIIVLRAIEDAMAYALARRSVTTAEVTVRVMDEIFEVLVRDNGSLVPGASEPKEARVRIWAAGERVNILGGECVISPQSLPETTVLLRIPIANLERTSEWSADD
jgi:signal transduction histidine kinase